MIAKSTFSKAQFLPVTALELTDQVFSWQDPDTGETLHFAVSRMAEAPEVQALEIITFALDPQFAAYAIFNRGIEEPRFNYYCENPHLITETPLLFATMDGGESQNLIDGQHRYVAAASLGFEDLRARLVPEEIWRKFLVDPYAMQVLLDAALRNPS